jgi:hypothetical protein
MVATSEKVRQVVEVYSQARDRTGRAYFSTREIARFLGWRNSTAGTALQAARAAGHIPRPTKEDVSQAASIYEEPSIAQLTRRIADAMAYKRVICGAEIEEAMFDKYDASGTFAEDNDHAIGTDHLHVHLDRPHPSDHGPRRRGEC